MLLGWCCAGGVVLWGKWWCYGDGVREVVMGEWCCGEGDDGEVVLWGGGDRGVVL